MSKPQLICADEIRIQSHIDRLMARWDKTVYLPDGTEAEIIERTHYPGRRQVVLTYREKPQEI